MTILCADITTGLMNWSAEELNHPRKPSFPMKNGQIMKATVFSVVGTENSPQPLDV
jgi:hypothetical protein